MARALSGAEGMTARFSDELSALRGSMSMTNREVSTLSNRFGRDLRRAFDGLVFDGVKLSDALRGVSGALSSAAYGVAMRPLERSAGAILEQGIGALSSAVFPFANGAPFAQGRVQPFAKGGVVSQPTQFAMRNGTGLMGEAGPEAIMPLQRGADGRLGVRAQGGQTVHVVMNISTPDAAGFKRSQSQIAAGLNRALMRGSRNS
ncbi:phage tail tape measure protein [Rhodobacteraceae bacterium]|nr:phage tail tape measure protein [Paracoccaceae bacterium]